MFVNCILLDAYALNVNCDMNKYYAVKLMNKFYHKRKLLLINMTLVLIHTQEKKKQMALTVRIIQTKRQQQKQH